MIIVIFLRLMSFSLGKWIDDHNIFGFLEFYGWVPHLASRHLLGTFLDESSIQPKVKSEFVEIEFDANYSWSCCSKLLDDLFLLILIRYTDLYIIINKEQAKGFGENMFAHGT